ncbi:MULTISPECIES: hypothetical protein [Altererythrobacter]|jgi:hypothetical protein|uniref:Uncharacterized protein n=1 Tax=Altererythrobacter ishigakiensis TaxID=476157 RepID=A0A562UWL1_9SPHN|nr:MULTISPECIES: hypothetical protein [Altererythrobacter]MBO6609133.1 hypothetical protein [Altererythrobacter sp.]MBO6641340.1 hypothetical protein [Altererythrobacter sp.]MBO6707962.1 hypothetical protein [Altererythrobacter sp.]MDX1704445.1 hypothetical protein [Altererythrobacter ishigakiensis]TWJ09976.1 hypothetical protein JN10_1632 [Altererythrobacter ishigakiensis]
MTREQKREALKERIAAAQARFGDRSPEDIASDAASAAFQYAKQNPVVVIGGALALGLALGSFTRRGRKAAAAGGLFTRLATDVAIGFAVAMYEKAHHAKSEVGLAKGQELIEQNSDQE